MKRVVRWWARHRLYVSAGLVLIVLAGGSVAIWLTASDGSKQAELGSSLLSGVVVGFAVLGIGRMLDLAIERGASEVALLRGSDSTQAEEEAQSVDLTAFAEVANVDVAAGDVKGALDRDSGRARAFYVVYEGSQRDVSRLDAQQIRLRIFESVADVESGLYFQFVTIPVPSPELRRLVGSDPNVTEGRLWWHISRSIEPQLRDAIRRGDIPTSQPSIAFEVETYDLTEAVRQARLDSDPEHSVTVGGVIYSFSEMTLSSRERELAMQVYQILGYDTGGPLEPEVGAWQYRMTVNREPSPFEAGKLNELAGYHSVQITFLLDGEVVLHVGRSF